MRFRFLASRRSIRQRNLRQRRNSRRSHNNPLPRYRSILPRQRKHPHLHNTRRQRSTLLPRCNVRTFRSTRQSAGSSPQRFRNLSHSNKAPSKLLDGLYGRGSVDICLDYSHPFVSAIRLVKSHIEKNWLRWWFWMLKFFWHHHWCYPPSRMHRRTPSGLLRLSKWSLHRLTNQMQIPRR